MEEWLAVPLVVLLSKTTLLTHPLKEVPKAFQKLVIQGAEAVGQRQNIFLGYDACYH